MIKRLAFECPLSSISDTFYILFTQYVSLPLSKVTPEEDEISTFFKLSESQAGIMNVPIAVESEPSHPDVKLFVHSSIQRPVVIRRNQLDLETFCDEYAKTNVNLKALLDRIFLTNGRLFHHERILCWFPRYLELFYEAHDRTMNR